MPCTWALGSLIDALKLKSQNKIPVTKMGPKSKTLLYVLCLKKTGRSISVYEPRVFVCF